MRSPRFGPWAARGMRFGLGVATIAVNVLAGIARNKWVAWNFHTAGIGVVGQLNAGQVWLGVAATMGLGVAVTRLSGAAFGAGDPARARAVLWNALALCGVSTAVACGLALVFAPAISTALLGEPTYAPLVRLSLLGAAGYALYQVLTGYFAGRSDVRAPFTLAIVGGIASAGATFLLVPRAGLAGAVIGVSLLLPVGVAGALAWHWREYRPLVRPLPRPLLDRAGTRALLGFGGAALTLALVDQGTLLALRSHFIRAHGVDANGLFQASVAFSQQGGAVFYAYLSNYVFGLVSGMREAGAMRDYTRRQWRPLLLLAAAGFAAAMLLGRPLLRLLYTDRFAAAQPMLAWTLLGEFGKVAYQCWAVAALPLGGTRLWLPLMLVFPAALAASYTALHLAGAGTQTLPLAYACAGISGLIVNGVVMSRRGVSLRPADAALLVALTGGLALLAHALSGRATP